MPAKAFPSSPLSPGSLAKTLGPGTRLLRGYLLVPLFSPFQERKEEAPRPPRFLCITPTTHPSLISPINENGLFSLPASRLTRRSLRPCQHFALTLGSSENKAGPGGGGFWDQPEPYLPSSGNGVRDQQSQNSNSWILSTETSVIRLTAVDADDPTVADHASVMYQLLKGDEHFAIDNSGLCD